MDTLTNLRTFLKVAESGGFSAAGRELGVATSVVTKRVDQLESSTQAQLFVRTTRTVTLTDAGQNWLNRVKLLLADADDVMSALTDSQEGLQGPLRVKMPTTLTILYLSDIVARFQKKHPKISLEIVLTDRPVNPAVEGFDVALGAFGTSYKDVTDFALCPLRRYLCASPEYLASAPELNHPKDLQNHTTLSFQPTGNNWAFEGKEGPVQVTVAPSINANEAHLLYTCALAGNGIAILPEYLAIPAFRDGTLVNVLKQYAPLDYAIKAQVPAARVLVRRITSFISFLQESFRPEPPWLRERSLSDEQLSDGDPSDR
ncbi:LysR substrate-binding domain-containing protein [Pseudomonas sp. zbq_4]|uniref:LysR family transcriptional regulator n=1 Tax=Pseudomonas sp. zbq_4 TaxID=3367240 RepID=UPI00370A4B02